MTCRVAWASGDLGLGHGLAGDGLGIGVGQGDAHRPLGVFDLGIALEARRLFADLLLLVQLGQADGLLAARLAGADLAQLVGVGHLDGGCFASASATPMAPELLLLGHVDAGLLHRLRRRLLADGLDVARIRP